MRSSQTALVTVLIAARNAEKSINAAINSVVRQSRARILLADDYSTDRTALLALYASNGQCEVVRPPSHDTLGATRAFLLKQLNTPFGIWLDADDEFLPGRIERAVTQLSQTGYELWADGAELANGNSRTNINVPAFLKESNVPHQLFGRNHIPAPGAIAFRADFAKNLSYDQGLHGCEDFDFILRALLQGGRFCYDDSIGYRINTSSTSLSRNLQNQKAMYARSLSKFESDFVRGFVERHGGKNAVTESVLISFEINRRNYAGALAMMINSQPILGHDQLMRQPSNSVGLAVLNYRTLFIAGTMYLRLGNHERAARLLEATKTLRQTPEVLNNLGVARRFKGNEDEAQSLFNCAIDLYPKYYDARNNQIYRDRVFITDLPLRTAPSHDEYSQ